MTQLASAVDAVDKLWTLDTLPPSPYVQVDDELVEIRASFPERIRQSTQEVLPPKIRVRRGVGGTTAASHAEDAELVAVYSAGGTGVPAFVHYSEEDPGAVGAGHIWIKPEDLFTSQSMLVRNAANDGWITPSVVYYGDGVAETPTVGLLVDTAFEVTVPDVGGGLGNLGVSGGSAHLAGGTARVELGSGSVGAGNVGIEGGIVQFFVSTNFLISGLPTVNPGVAGSIWNDGGTLKISAG